VNDMIEYIGIPFLKDGATREGLDCWRLVVMVYKDRLNIDLPACSGIFADKSLASLKRISRLIKETKKQWTEVKKPAPYDVVLLRTSSFHVGLVTGRRTMLHISEEINSTIEEFTSLQWKDKVEGFYHYAG